MEFIDYTFRYATVNHGSQLDSAHKELLNAALTATYIAYAPYSKFCVGAALMLEDGQIIKGANQENASYPCGICAERAVLFHYGNLNLNKKINCMAITVTGNIHILKTPVAPCGLCRQVICEFEQNNGSPIELVLGHPESACYIIPQASQLLPFTFNSKYLL